jgi:heme/copper-type cytochrome/quinol oxidase subunit 2
MFVVVVTMMMIGSDHYGTSTFVLPPPPSSRRLLLGSSSSSMGTLVIPTPTRLSTFLVKPDTATIRRRNDWAFAAAAATERDDDDDDDETKTISSTTTLRNDDASLSSSSPSSSSSSSSVPNTKDEALAAVAAVGWSIPGSRGDSGRNILEEEEEDSSALTSNDPFVQAIDASIQLEMGVSLEDLLNPAKVVNLERDLYRYRRQLAQLTGATIATMTTTTTATTTLTTTADCDNGGGGAEADMLRQLIQTKEATLLTERRSVFRGWFKNVFLYQAILSFGLSYVMATTPATLFGHYDWYNNPQYNMDLSISVLGYWWWWLFVIPSLRSRRPQGYEKQALDLAFLASPVVSLIAPVVVTKDTGMIWWANAVVVGGAYGYAFWSSRQHNQNDDNDDDDDDSHSTSQTPPPPKWWKFVYQSLDFGSGRERGARNSINK